MKKNVWLKSVLTMMLLSMLLLSACSSEESPQGGETGNDIESYPEKPITWVIPDSAGGGLDVTIRILAPYVEKYMPNDAKFVMENLPGATQTIALTKVYNSEPDGYTIGQASVAPLTIMPHFGETAYNGYEDFEMIASVYDAAHFLMVPADAPYDTFDEFLEYVKEHPGEVRVGIDGTFNVQHLPLMSFQKEAGVDLNEIVYKSSGETKMAVLSHEIEAGIIPHHLVISEYEEGTLKPLINLMEVKPDIFSDVPTFKEKGYTPGQLFVGTIAPKGTPEDKLAILSEAIEKALQDPELLETFAKQQTLINYNDPEEYRKRLEELDPINKQILEDLGAID